MYISKNKILFALLLATAHCATHACLLPECVKKTFSLWSRLSRFKKVALGTVATGITVGLAIWTISKKRKCLEQKQEMCNVQLINACKVGNLDDVEGLCKRGADLHCGIPDVMCLDDDLFMTVKNGPMAEAIKNGHLDVVKFLVEHGVEINGDLCVLIEGTEPTESPSSLLLTLCYQQFDIMKYLVESGANVNVSGVHRALEVRYKDFAGSSEEQAFSKFLQEDPFVAYLLKNGLSVQF